jgi:hypothetical protein
MGRLNIEPLMILPDGSSLVISTESRDGEFSCALYRVVETDDRAVFHVVSKHFPPAPTCLSAQEYAYRYAVGLYPRFVEVLRKPPYLVWHGPPSTGMP